ncbi:MAG TPA: Crp/Fnr family transcriptional regulator [Pyrinomonadaceae bacterium]|nr:Crp/Fnr family transcriptional regulator [Pyrinomonadaceae bacterium]
MSYDGQSTRPRSNRILSATPAEEYERLCPRLEYVELRRGDVLHEAGEHLSHVYFPYAGTLSVTVQMRDGDETEVGTIGREGMLGLPLVLGTDTAPLRAFSQVSGGAMRMRTADFAEEVNRRAGFYTLLLRYAQSFFVQTAQTAACNRLHPMEARLPKWLLTTRDLAQTDRLDLTHEFVAVMLGVRRAGVTEALGLLRAEGLIDHSRGHITVLDAEGLRRKSCECYGVVRDEYDRLLSPVAPSLLLPGVRLGREGIGAQG